MSSKQAEFKIRVPSKEILEKFYFIGTFNSTEELEDSKNKQIFKDNDDWTLQTQPNWRQLGLNHILGPKNKLAPRIVKSKKQNKIFVGDHDSALSQSSNRYFILMKAPETANTVYAVPVNSWFNFRPYVQIPEQKTTEQAEEEIKKRTMSSMGDGKGGGKARGRKGGDESEDTSWVTSLKRGGGGGGGRLGGELDDLDQDEVDEDGWGVNVLQLKRKNKKQDFDDVLGEMDEDKNVPISHDHDAAEYMQEMQNIPEDAEGWDHDQMVDDDDVDMDVAEAVAQQEQEQKEYQNDWRKKVMEAGDEEQGLMDAIELYDLDDVAADDTNRNQMNQKDFDDWEKGNVKDESPNPMDEDIVIPPGSTPPQLGSTPPQAATTPSPQPASTPPPARTNPTPITKGALAVPGVNKRRPAPSPGASIKKIKTEEGLGVGAGEAGLSQVGKMVLELFRERGGQGVGVGEVASWCKSRGEGSIPDIMQALQQLTVKEGGGVGKQQLLRLKDNWVNKDGG